ncbi:ATP-binding protein [Streptomyces violaceusniger]|uniref:ATP-binding protein n=1 Tax=Streptomyces violaceusniger TaxID=68280 RepID=UPI00380B5E36
MGEPYEVKFRLSRRRNSVPRSRALLHSVLGAWDIGQDVREVAELILSELVTNALRVRVPNDRLVGVRIVRLLEEGVLRLEVSDAGDGKPEVRKPEEDETCGRGLLLVKALAHRWGYEGRSCGIGKTIWAELKAPDLVSARDGTAVAACTVRAGQSVWERGAWHLVRSVDTQQQASDGLTVVLRFDDGSAMRIDAAEPLTIRAANATP